MSESVKHAARGLIAASLVLSCVLFSPSLADPVNVIKLTVVVVGALGLLFLGVLAVVRPREALLPAGALAWTATALAGALVVAALTAPSLTTAVVGTSGRNSGLLAYLAGLTMLFVGLRVWTASSAPVLLLGLVAAGVFTASYGLLQRAGIDPINWSNPFNPIIASLGNPDFASGYLGICTPAAAWGALWRRWPIFFRVGSALLALVFLVTAVLSEASQGPLAAAAGLSVLLVAWLLERGGVSARRGLIALGALVALGVAGLGAGAAKIGPAAGLFTSGGSEARGWYWRAALRMFQDHPLTGVGLDHYGSYFRQVRPDEAVTKLGGNEFSDAAHSVPLQMLAQGGLLLAGAYLAFTIAIVIVLVTGLRRTEGQARLALAGVGGCWVAYTVQSLVSIDQVPLLTVQFACAGAIGGIVGGQLRRHRLPGALAEPPAGKGRRQGRVVIRERDLNGVDAAVLGAAAVAILVAFWFSLLPLRASAATHAGDTALRNGDGTTALRELTKATDLLPGVGESWRKLGQLYETAQQPEAALKAYRSGVEHDPRNVYLLLNAARLAETQKDLDSARSMLRRAVQLDPTNPETVLPAASFHTSQGGPQEAEQILARVLEVLPSNASLWAADGTAKATRKDTAGARASFERALQLEPGNSVAAEGLKQLSGAQQPV